MKRIISSFDPETNPADAVRSCIYSLNSDITKLHNIVSIWNKKLNNHPDDDTLMNRIVDDSAYMQNMIDDILRHYNK